MSDTARFIGSVNINQMTRVYRERFAGNEHDIRFNDTQSLVMKVDFELPSMVRIGDIQREANLLLHRHVNQMAREIAEIFERAQEQKGQR